MAQQNQTGKEGESEARVYLQKKGYRILHSNWHFHHYELDIVAQHGHELVVVEVKTRSEAPLLEPEDAIDGKKIKRTVAAADAYIRYFNCDMPVRRDNHLERFIRLSHPRPYRGCILSPLPLNKTVLRAMKHQVITITP